MDRRTFNKLASFTALAALAETADLSAAQAAAVTGEVVLEDDQRSPHSIPSPRAHPA